MPYLTIRAKFIIFLIFCLLLWVKITDILRFKYKDCISLGNTIDECFVMRRQTLSVINEDRLILGD